MTWCCKQACRRKVVRVWAYLFCHLMGSFRCHQVVDFTGRCKLICFLLLLRVRNSCANHPELLYSAPGTLLDSVASMSRPASLLDGAVAASEVCHLCDCKAMGSNETWMFEVVLKFRVRAFLKIRDGTFTKYVRNLWKAGCSCSIWSWLGASAQQLTNLLILEIISEWTLNTPPPDCPGVWSASIDSSNLVFMFHAYRLLLHCLRSLYIMSCCSDLPDMAST